MAVQTGTAKNGDQFILGEDRRWHRASDEDTAILNRPAWDIIKQSALSTANGLVELGGAAVLSLSPSARDTTDELFESALQNLGGGRTSELRPAAAGIGSGAVEGLLEVATAGGFKALRARRLATRSRAEVAGKAATTASPISEINSDVVQTVGELSTSFGADSAGAAARGGFWQSLKRMPKLNQFLEGLEDMIGTARPLSGGQRAVLKVGADGTNAVQRTGFKLLPGQANGNNVLAEVISRDPLMADAFDSVLNENSDTFMRLISKSLGVEPGHHGRDFRHLGRQSVGGMFDDVVAKLPDIEIPSDLVETISTTLTPRQRTLLDLEGTLRGADIKEIREALSGQLAAVTRKEGSSGVTARTLRETQEAFDQVVEEAINDPAVLAQWHEARQRWRLVRAFDRSTSITKDGDVSVRGLVTNMEREFPLEFGRSNLTRNVSGLPPDMVELMDFARVANTFISNLADSGTGTTMSLLNDIAHPANFIKKRAAARFISDVLLNRPDIADALPGLDVVQ